MDCPRCGDPLESYRLDDSETFACGNCAYLGVPVDHKSDGSTRESWDDALDRFDEQSQTVRTVTEITDTDVFSTVTDSESEETDRESDDTSEDRVETPADAESADEEPDPDPPAEVTDDHTDQSPEDETEDDTADGNTEPASADASG